MTRFEPGSSSIGIHCTVNCETTTALQGWASTTDGPLASKMINSPFPMLCGFKVFYWTIHATFLFVFVLLTLQFNY